MIKAIIFDLDNTLLDFMTMKSNAIKSAVDGMIKNGLEIILLISFNIKIKNHYIYK